MVRPRRALEVGMGIGILMQAMAEAFSSWSLEEIDISPKNVAVARRLHPGGVLLCGAEPVRDGFFSYLGQPFARIAGLREGDDPQQ